MPMRAVIYARYSSENQRDASIEDQVELGRRYIERQGWTLVNTYADRALSGGSRMRPGFLQMLADAEAGRFEVVVCESVDRLGRKLSDVADLFDRLTFKGVELFAVNTGPITQMHVGIMGTMAQMYVADLREKTRRGQLAGHGPARSPGVSPTVTRWLYHRRAATRLESGASNRTRPAWFAASMVNTPRENRHGISLVI